MKTFREFYLKYKGRSSRDFDLVVVSVGDDTSPNLFGVERSVNEEDSGGKVPVFKGFNYSCPSIPITFAKIKDTKLLPITQEDEFKIAQWLFGDDEYHPLQSDDNDEVIYYGAFTKAEKYFNALRLGYFKTTFRLSSPCAYSPIRHNNYYVRNNEKTFEIDCRTNVENYYYPDVEFRLVGENTGVKITNLTLNETMEFKDLPKETHLYCYNEGMKEIVCKNNKDLNARPNFNKTWLRLRYGRNLIKVEGNCDIDILAQYKIAIP